MNNLLTHQKIPRKNLTRAYMTDCATNTERAAAMYGP